MSSFGTGTAALYEAFLALLPGLLIATSPARCSPDRALSLLGLGQPGAQSVHQRPITVPGPEFPALEAGPQTDAPAAAAGAGSTQAPTNAAGGPARAPSHVGARSNVSTSVLSDAPSQGHGASRDNQTARGLTVHLLDGFQVSMGGADVVEIPRGKPSSLFKLLLLHRRRPLSRASICGALWPDADPESARNSLNVAMHRLRRAIGRPRIVQFSESQYQLDAATEIWLDAERFLWHAAVGVFLDGNGRTARAIGSYEMALALYRTDLIDDGEHEPALESDSQVLIDRLNQVLERLSSLREESGDLHACLRVARRHLALDDCNEIVHRRMMRCYAELGQPQLAERQYRDCVSALMSHLGVHPHAETTELCRQIGSTGAS